ncbi:MAG: glycosyltransferase [Clostridia bacterium]|nr:glycosyltransferase [Clostridia bacterium]
MISNKEKNFISAVVYVHNNEKEIGKFIEKINEQLNQNFEKYEIICVNDKSTDNSVQEIEKIANQVHGASISIINMSYYQGIELSMNAGVDLSIGDFVYEFDSIYIDYELDVIRKIYQEALQGYDIVSAKSNTKKRISSRIFYKIFNQNSNNMYQIHTETFRILSRRAINRVKAMNKTVPYRKAIYANCGLKLNVVIYKAIKNVQTKLTKETTDTRKDLAMDSIILFTDVSYKFAVIMAIMMMFVAIGTGIYTLYIFLCAKPIAGWTTTMLLLSFAFFGIFAILTIMIKYLAILVDLIFKKQKYLIESVNKITK